MKLFLTSTLANDINYVALDEIEAIIFFYLSHFSFLGQKSNDFFFIFWIKWEQQNMFLKLTG